jgi:hypothetical protein
VETGNVSPLPSTTTTGSNFTNRQSSAQMGRGKSGPITYSTDGVFGTSAAFEGLAALAILITASFALIRIRINRDAARKCFYWLYGVMAVLIMYNVPPIPASPV